MEFWDGENLVMVAVCDKLNDGISAVYTFFDPDMPQLSLGTLGILAQIEYIKRLNLAYVYLGFWIPDSDKMRYKANFQPLEVLIDGQWLYFEGKLSKERVEPYLQEAIKKHFRAQWQS